MKKYLAILIAAFMLFSMVACGTGDGNDNGGGNNDDESSHNWMADYNMSNLAVPDGATVSDPLSYGNPKRDIKRDTAFTEAEVAAFAQSVFENCGSPYKKGWDSEKNEATRIELANAEDAKGLDEYGWVYDVDGVTYNIRIYFGIETTIGFEKY